MISKSLIDKAGRVLSGRSQMDEDSVIGYGEVLDEYRKKHLQPLTEATWEIQSLLDRVGVQYVIAQRLKRKPQIIRKLRRFSVRLSQLQDIGGARVVVDGNSDVQMLLDYMTKEAKIGSMKISRVTDYRERGRDDSGYRAAHLIFDASGIAIELQVRSKIQHYWAEAIERTSVVYGHYLKELDGDQIVLSYFKYLSDAFYDIEMGYKIEPQKKIRLAKLRGDAEAVIDSVDKKNISSGYVNDGVIKTLCEKEKALGPNRVNNWIIVFNWNEGNFITWDVVDRDPDNAIRTYVEYEKNFPQEDGFEVVLIGSASVSAIRDTHSHYFGLSYSGDALETLDESIIGFSRRMDIDIGSRDILAVMYRKHYWGNKSVSLDTLKNHYCKENIGFQSSLEALIDKGLIRQRFIGSGFSLNVDKKMEIEKYI